MIDRYRILIVLFFVFSCFLFAQNTDITIFYSGSLNGNLDGCSCEYAPKAGLVKRAAFLRHRDADSSLLLSGGDLFDVFPDEALHTEISEAFAELGYDAVGLGDQDLAEGVEWMLQAHAPFRADNVETRSVDGSWHRLSSPLIIEKQGIRFGILSITEGDVFRLLPEEIQQDIRSVEPVEAATELVREFQSQTDYLILLFHGYDSTMDKIRAACPGLDLVILTHQQMLVQQLDSPPFLVSPGEAGNLVGVLDLTFKDGDLISFNHRFQEFDYNTDPDDLLIRERSDRYTKILIDRIKKR